VLFENLGLSFLHIPQTNPRADYLAQQPEIDAAVSRVLAGGGYILGREVEIFESAFADFIGVAHAVACASGTDAIELALRACGIGTGDLAFTVSHTAVATRCGYRTRRCGRSVNR
jgi:dTDP-4-amino-4,6-dideoxygalactose transaminase